MNGTIVIATENAHKMTEIREILTDPGLRLVTMKEAGADVEIVEDGQTFEENALIKARTVAKACGRLTLADDSGLVIDALDGAPGIHSARFMGHDTSYAVKNRALIDMVNERCRQQEGGDEDRPGAEADGTPGPLRAARFVCVVAAVWPDGRERTATGVMEGRIAFEISGENGFGYDPVFFLPEYGVTSAQISAGEKNRISHRGQAFRRMREILEREKL